MVDKKKGTWAFTGSEFGHSVGVWDTIYSYWGETLAGFCNLLVALSFVFFCSESMSQPCYGCGVDSEPRVTLGLVGHRLFQVGLELFANIFDHRADATIAAKATGAMSWAFITAMKKNPQQSYVQLLNSIRDELATKYTQKPQLSCSHPLGKSPHTISNHWFTFPILTNQLDTNLLFVM